MSFTTFSQPQATILKEKLFILLSRSWPSARARRERSQREEVWTKGFFKWKVFTRSEVHANPGGFYLQCPKEKKKK